MKKILFFLCFWILLSSCAGWDSVSEVSSIDQTTETQEAFEMIAKEVSNNPEATSNSWVMPTGNKIYAFPYPHKCEILWTITYNYPEKEMDLTQNSAINILNRDWLSYTWSIRDIGGKAMTLLAEYQDDPGVYTDEEMKEMFSDWFNEMVEKMQSLFKDSCEKWDLDESIFELPEWVEFVKA